jgi:Helix-turn-helix domain
MKPETEQTVSSTGPDQKEAASNGSIPGKSVLNQIEAARFLRVQPRTLESWRQRRTGPRFIRYSQRCVRYRPRDLQEWLDAQAVETVPVR